MDVFSHGLWSGAVYKVINKKIKKSLSIKWAVFLGVFPDVFAFASMFIWIFWSIIFGHLNFSDIPRPENVEPAHRDTLFIFKLTNTLYNFSHSLVIFLIIFGLVYLIFRRPIWEMGAWLLHILIDIPTHSYIFYPTPFLWPFSNIKFDGLSWGTPWFLVLNYSLIACFYSYLYIANKKRLKFLKKQ